MATTIRYGDRLQFHAISNYQKNDDNNNETKTKTKSKSGSRREVEEEGVVGEYSKTAFYQSSSLFALPPFPSDEIERRSFTPSAFTILPCDSMTSTSTTTNPTTTTPSSKELIGTPLRYGDPFVLVDDANRSWSNRTSMRTGYVGPRRRSRSGEMYMSFTSRDKPAKMQVCYDDKGNKKKNIFML